MGSTILGLDKSKPNMGLSTTLNADESVARGCALQCAILSPMFKVKEFHVADIVEYPVVISWEKDAEASAMEVEEASKRTEKDLEEEWGGHGVYNQDLRKFWDLKNDDWKYDAIPEVWNGKNIADFVDSDILEKLAVLEAEEEEILRNMEAAAVDARGNMDLSSDEELLYDEIQYQKAKKHEQHTEVFARNHALRPRKIHERTLPGMDEHLSDLGYDLGVFMERAEDVKKKALEKFKEKEEKQ